MSKLFFTLPHLYDVKKKSPGTARQYKLETARRAEKEEI